MVFWLELNCKLVGLSKIVNYAYWVEQNCKESAVWQQHQDWHIWNHGQGAVVGKALRRRGGGRRKSFGKRKRYGRDVTDQEVDAAIDELFLKATLNDADDCAKKYVCLVSAADEEALDEMERSVASAFAPEGFIDVSSPSARFQLAATMGRVAGYKQCEVIQLILFFYLTTI